jgi:hypothetical protein
VIGHLLEIADLVQAGLAIRARLQVRDDAMSRGAAGAIMLK